MAFDEGLAERIRTLLAPQTGAHERKMFGGLCFLFDGNMACGIVGDELMVRVGPASWADALTQPHAREMDFTGRSMRGMVYVGADGIAEDADLAAWVERGLAFARSLPAK
jgi:TfoX/Sxy family transcriptional regulator of competence genes